MLCRWATNRGLWSVVAAMVMFGGTFAAAQEQGGERPVREDWQVMALLEEGADQLPPDELAAFWGNDVPDDKSLLLGGPESLLLSFAVNGTSLNYFDLVYVTRDGRAYVRGDVLESMRIVPPPAGRLPKGVVAGFHPIHLVPGLVYEIDRKALQLDIACAAACFKITELSARYTAITATPTQIGNGGFVNYDANVEYRDFDFDITSLFEVGYFDEHGSFLTTFAAQDLANSATALRLETSFTIDDQAQRRRLVLGDSISRNAVWSQPVRFAGVRYGNEFSMTPGFVSLPSPDFAGEAALPSTIDVFVDGVRRFTSEVPAGPYQVRDLPVLSGTGEAQIIVRDVLGREQVYTESYALGRAMLRPGLSDWSISAGVLREDFAVRSGTYGDGFVDAIYAQGISTELTVEMQGQLSSDVGSAGAGVTYAKPGFGVFSLAAALSKTDEDMGSYLGAGWDWSYGAVSFSTNIETASAPFRALGQDLTRDADKYRWRVRGGVRIGDGNLSASYVDLKRRGRSDFRSISLGLTTRLSRRFSVSVNGFRQIKPTRSDTVLLSVSAAFGAGRVGGLSAKKDRAGQYSISASVQESAPVEGGFGYRLRVGQDDKARFSDGTLSYRGDIIESSIGWSDAQRQTQLRGTARGGLVMADGHVRLSRYVTSSFAIVDVADIEGVRVYADRRLAGRTGAGGTIAVTQLRPWEKNVISIEGADLPLDWPVTQFDYDIVPANRTGHFLKIEGSVGRSAVMSLRLVDGTSPPVGARITFDDSEDTYFVGEEGYSFVASLPQTTSVTVAWPNGSCQAQLSLPANDVPQIMLGEVICR